MQSFVDAKTFSQNDILYVGYQINRDLQALSDAYPNILTPRYALGLSNSCTIFLSSNAVTHIGYSIYDPTNNNLVYHELLYKVQYDGDVKGGQNGGGGRAITSIRVPPSAKFTAWVKWSQTMLSLSEAAQEQIVSGTDWSIPRKGTPFYGTYVGGNWQDKGKYSSGALSAAAREYTGREI